MPAARQDDDDDAAAAAPPPPPPPQAHEVPTNFSGSARVVAKAAGAGAAGAAGGRKHTQQKADYYSAGCTDLAQPSALTLKKLEKRRQLTANSDRLVIVLVGLPGRGKSFVARKLSNYLTWRGTECRVFNVGKYRRQAAQESESQGAGESGACDANFFDSQNTAAARLREEVAAVAMREMLGWLDRDEEDAAAASSPAATPTASPSNGIKRAVENMDDTHHPLPNLFEGTPGNSPTRGADRSKRAASFAAGTKPLLPQKAQPPPSSSSAQSHRRTASNSTDWQRRGRHGHGHGQNHHRAVMRSERVAIYDATNSTRARRKWILEEITSPQKRKGKQGTGVIFVESICDDEELLEENFRFKVQNSPDFKGMDEATAIADLRNRVKKYEEQYQPVSDDSLSYIKIFNLSSKLMVNHIYGRMAKIIVPSLMSWNIGNRPIYITRAGETVSLAMHHQRSVLGHGNGRGEGGVPQSVKDMRWVAPNSTPPAPPPPDTTTGSGSPATVSAASALASAASASAARSSSRLPPRLPLDSRVLSPSPAAAVGLSPLAVPLSKSLARNSRLAPRGAAFRDALCEFVKNEGKEFISHQQRAASREQHGDLGSGTTTTAGSASIPSRDFNTGTSINGIRNRCSSWGGLGDAMGNSAATSDLDSDYLRKLKSMDDGCCDDDGDDDDNGDGGLLRRTRTASMDSFDENLELSGTYLDADGRFPFPCHVMSSTMPRSVETARWDRLPYPVEELSNLNPLDKGDFVGHELEDIAQTNPEWYAQLEEDPFRTRFPGGECYGDLINRLEPAIIDMEQQVGLVVVVSHVSVIQALVAYFRSTPVQKCTSIEVPLHTVIKFTPSRGGGWVESRHKLPLRDGDDQQDGENSGGDNDTASTGRTSSEGGEEEANTASDSLTKSPTPIWGDHFKPLSRKNSLNREEEREKLAAPAL